MNNANSPQQISHGFLAATGTKIFRYYEDRIPRNSPVLLVSNHRSFMDAPILMAAVERPIRFACHHYMGQVPVMREIVTGQLGCFPLDAAPSSQQGFFQRALQLLQANQVVGVFPEGTTPMVQFTQPNSINTFQRGFAHLALRANAGSDINPVKDLVILPVAISSIAETISSAVPLRLLSLFDPTEPLFNQNGWHPLVIYRRVAVLIGRPHRITPLMRQQYPGKQAKSVVADLTNTCQTEIAELLRQGYY